MTNRSQSVLSFGSRIVGAGRYASIRTFGGFKASGDIHAMRSRSFGNCVIQGRCSVKHLFSAGDIHVLDALQAETIRVFGNVVVNGQMTSTQIRAMGNVTATGRVSCQRLHMRGDAHFDSGAIAEQFKLTGTCSIRGVISAKCVQIKSRGHCEMDQIGGSTITIRAGWDEDGCAGKGGLLNWRCRGTSQIRVVEGDSIYLENTTAGIVRGQSITLGAGCHIGTIEYSKSLKQHSSAVVESVSHIAQTREEHAFPSEKEKRNE